MIRVDGFEIGRCNKKCGCVLSDPYEVQKIIQWRLPKVRSLQEAKKNENLTFWVSIFKGSNELSSELI